jgi:hypothetical protein
MTLEFDKVLDSQCVYELRKRANGQSMYGPSKVFMQAMCT